MGYFGDIYLPPTNFNQPLYTLSRESIAPQHTFSNEKEEEATLFGTNTAYHSHYTFDLVAYFADFC